MSAGRQRVVMLGFDAMDPALTERMARGGRLPAFDELFGSAARRAIRGTPFWESLSDAGKRVAVLDVPHSRAGAPIRGVQVSEWGCHDRHFGLRTHPPELRQEIAD